MPRRAVAARAPSPTVVGVGEGLGGVACRELPAELYARKSLRHEQQLTDERWAGDRRARARPAALVQARCGHSSPGPFTRTVVRVVHRYVAHTSWLSGTGRVTVLIDTAPHPIRQRQCTDTLVYRYTGVSIDIRHMEYGPLESPTATRNREEHRR